VLIIDLVSSQLPLDERLVHKTEEIFKKWDYMYT